MGAAIRWLLLCMVMGMAMGCVSAENRKPIALRQGSVDLECEERLLSVRAIGDRLYAVSGCGQSAVYRVICKLTTSSCDPLRVE
jgi:hypothetical protein